MKHFFVLILSVLLISCGMSDEEKAIEAFTNKVDDKTSLDKSFKSKSIKLDSTITAKDSLKYYVNEMDTTWKELPVNQALDSIQKMVESIIESTNSLNELAESYDDLADEYDKSQYLYYKADGHRRSAEETRETVKNGLALAEEVKSTIPNIKRLNALGDQPVAYIYECEYSFKNPLLDGNKVERKAKFLLSADKKTALRELE